ncbi:hypothetical protein ETH_00009305 [Eimeria tenella]|uniref:Uncharacterized protein n=1 Tax=Eimeria tenella TaxID=5802 RepID=U6L564_EIMTE|nr:hypothetical protein ETH_00009305 [Eimeria tenella]CDJ45311.1 hypothetical protein ETH_00009305 [Eimeria tenella]|eukprot:XP_013236057.1 hypothetical protein ETH_00009305 [Eimeria tenella]
MGTMMHSLDAAATGEQQRKQQHRKCLGCVLKRCFCCWCCCSNCCCSCCGCSCSTGETAGIGRFMLSSSSNWYSASIFATAAAAAK